MSFRNLIVLFLIIISSCQSHKELEYNYITSTYKKYSTSISRNENDDKFYYSKFNNKTNIEHYVSIESKNKNKISISGYLIYYKYGNEFLLKNRKVYSYKYFLNDTCYSYSLEYRNKNWEFEGSPYTGYMQKKSESKIILYFSTYLLNEISCEYSLDDTFKNLDLEECIFMPFVKQGYIINTNNNKIYLKTKVVMSDINIKNYPKIFYDTLYFSKE